MKRIDIFCASQAATAICLQNASSSPSSAVLLGGAAIDRHNPIIGDSRRAPKSLPPCTTSEPPISPQKLLPKKKKNKKILADENENQLKKIDFRKRWSCTRPGDFLSPPGSTRYLLREKAESDEITEFEDVKTEELCSSESVHQVVFLRVSLHCRGCEKKLRKHLSRMDGVTSFDIDFMAKKVTVEGNVTPLGVLSSISKVKNAQLWSPAISSETISKETMHN
ncbi:hypothetical protein ACS0TY_015977 [Phlomoides rotata]